MSTPKNRIKDLKDRLKESEKILGTKYTIDSLAEKLHALPRGTIIPDMVMCISGREIKEVMATLGDLAIKLADEKEPTRKLRVDVLLKNENIMYHESLAQLCKYTNAPLNDILELAFCIGLARVSTELMSEISDHFMPEKGN